MRAKVRCPTTGRIFEAMVQAINGRLCWIDNTRVEIIGYYGESIAPYQILRIIERWPITDLVWAGEERDKTIRINKTFDKETLKLRANAKAFFRRNSLPKPKERLLSLKVKHLSLVREISKSRSKENV